MGTGRPVTVYREVGSITKTGSLRLISNIKVYCVVEAEPRSYQSKFASSTIFANPLLPTWFW